MYSYPLIKNTNKKECTDTHNMDEYTDSMLSKGRHHKTVWLQLYWIQEQAKWIDVDRSQKSDYPWVGEMARENFWGNGNVLYLDLDGGYSDVYICKNSLSSTLQICTLFYLISMLDLI